MTAGPFPRLRPTGWWRRPSPSRHQRLPLAKAHPPKISLHKPPPMAYHKPRNAPVAQLDRALPSEGRGREFESRRVRQFLEVKQTVISSCGSGSEPLSLVATNVQPTGGVRRPSTSSRVPLIAGSPVLEKRGVPPFSGLRRRTKSQYPALSGSALWKNFPKNS